MLDFHAHIIDIRAGDAWIFVFKNDEIDKSEIFMVLFTLQKISLTTMLPF